MLGSGRQTGTSGAGAGVSTSGVATGVGAGLSAGFFTQSLFQQAGWCGTGAKPGAGAAGGAVAGAQIGNMLGVPVVGALAGAAVGALVVAIQDPKVRQAMQVHWPGFRQLNAFQRFAAGDILGGLSDIAGAGLLGTLKRLFKAEADNAYFTAIRTVEERAQGGFFRGPDALTNRTCPIFPAPSLPPCFSRSTRPLPGI
jgi:hypothetical protein